MDTDSGQSVEGESESAVGSEGSGDDTVPDELPLDRVYEILKNSRRRQTLAYLNENDGEATVGNLAEHIAAIENDVSVKALTSPQRKRVYVGLYQCHLPKMDDMNILRFDKPRGTVELAAGATQFDPYIGDSDTFPWSRLYLGVSVAGIGLVTVSAVGILPLWVTYTSVSLAVLAIVAICSAIHVYVENSLVEGGA